MLKNQIWDLTNNNVISFSFEILVEKSLVGGILDKCNSYSVSMTRLMPFFRIGYILKLLPSGSHL